MNQIDDTSSYLDQVERPTLILDVNRSKNNLARMKAKADKNQVFFRPHFKTHQSASVGRWFREGGVSAIAVSSVDMALYFARHGWNDITLAFPVNPRQLAAINSLAAAIKLNLLVESLEMVEFLNQNLTSPVEAWIKIDVGYGRTGIPWNQADQVKAVARAMVDSPIKLSGLLTHTGHTYQAKSVTEVQTITSEAISRLSGLKSSLIEAGLGPILISVGDTPGCSLVDDFSGVDELRPGVFIFYDLMQLALGACAETDIAVAVACPVVAKHPERDIIIIYGGAVHLSKDYIIAPDGTKCFGRIARPQADGWGPLLPDAQVISVSQEHGLVRVPAEIMKQETWSWSFRCTPAYARISSGAI
ncbi:MAG: alanine racemase [Deltaproteobacteria bacterium]|nr:alanine racemase [Deltaproteobacteria bacterium]